MMKSTTNPINVVVIDDDEAVRDSLGNLLKSAGYRVKLFASARNFLSETEARHADVIVLDNGMPDMTGLELLERLRNEKQTTPIIFISGNLTKAVKTRAERLGANAIFEKPLANGILLATLRELGASAVGSSTP